MDASPRTLLLVPQLLAQTAAPPRGAGPQMGGLAVAPSCTLRTACPRAWVRVCPSDPLRPSGRAPRCSSMVPRVFAANRVSLWFGPSTALRCATTRRSNAGNKYASPPLIRISTSTMRGPFGLAASGWRRRSSSPRATVVLSRGWYAAATRSRCLFSAASIDCACCPRT